MAIIMRCFVMNSIGMFGNFINFYGNFMNSYGYNNKNNLVILKHNCRRAHLLKFTFMNFIDFVMNII